MSNFSGGAGRSNNASISFGGVAGDALESIAEGTLGRSRESARGPKPECSSHAAPVQRVACATSSDGSAERARRLS
jgi:hypothetical protein